MTGKNSSKNSYVSPGARPEPRVPGLRQIILSYEGRDEEIRVKPPDLSIHGMFISTSRRFPEGAVLNLRFQLANTGVEVQTRGEVRYCLPGVGVGVEFIGISPEAEQKIAREVDCQTKGRHPGNGSSKTVRGNGRGIPRKPRKPPSSH